MINMKASTRAFKERQVVLLMNPSPPKQQLGYVYGMEKALLPKDERTPKSDLQQMTKQEVSNYIDFLKQMYHEAKQFEAEVI